MRTGLYSHLDRRAVGKGGALDVDTPVGVAVPVEVDGGANGGGAGGGSGRGGCGRGGACAAPGGGGREGREDGKLDGSEEHYDGGVCVIMGDTTVRERV